MADVSSRTRVYLPDDFGGIDPRARAAFLLLTRQVVPLRAGGGCERVPKAADRRARTHLHVQWAEMLPEFFQEYQ